ncbi:Nad binding rossmann fold-containing protein [Colletotrichum higginsianum IMI 349063]|uniref:Nad binding rossmann fold-containing protein n=2 Tax=Colletotrichum higginsianum TaxID=80884 RepID=A0A1B7YE93_COLHI|nr:Nad binding rossmann fold-containing protein [Colletotrichum higginsianum IMI 349063]OBR10407.1 Nad binding rossmann fold-containing protein [Colletotrichum higginsianum IMI 349063]TID07507.1 scyllo-inositol 2-dehydrogenase (NAD(+)) [Colletotrichum higginsianum]
MSGEKLNVAVAGLGRMGLRHARHFATLTPKANLIAVSSPVQAELDAAVAEFGPLKTYLDYDEMLRQEPTLQAVIVASATTVHAEQAIKAIERGLHVLCEKPLSTSVDIVCSDPPSLSSTYPIFYLCFLGTMTIASSAPPTDCEGKQQSQSVVTAYEKSLIKNPSQKVICGFSRRFDASYRDAHQRVARGDIGAPSVFRSQTCDKLDPSGFFVDYAEFSGGIFVDCSIHDIDLALWFFGEDSVVKSVAAVGITAVQEGLRKHNDRDNAVAVVEFYGGKIAQLFCSRMMAAGQEDTTEIFGTRGKVAVNTQPQLNLVNLYEPTGIRREIPPDYYGRFREAFIAEANEFTACCLNDTEPPMKLTGAVSAVKIGCALQESLITGKKIEFDERGERIESARL